MRHRLWKRVLLLVLLGLVVLVFDISLIRAQVVAPRAQFNYQGVLRDASDRPLDGLYVMTFRLFDAPAGGAEILVDYHDDAHGGGAVRVTNGLFSVPVGSGLAVDGAGPGNFTTVTDAFAAYSPIYLEVTIGTEVLSPRIEVVPTGAALNAALLGGRGPSGFIDTTASGQRKDGPLAIYSNDPLTSGLIVRGGTGATVSSNAPGATGQAQLGAGNTGVVATGSEAGAQFSNSVSSGFVRLAYHDEGVDAESNVEAGIFTNPQGGTARLGTKTEGLFAIGPVNAARFMNNVGNGSASLGGATVGISASGTTAGHFASAGGPATVDLANSESGVAATGVSTGGTFGTAGGLGRAELASGDYGVRGFGKFAGYFDAAPMNGSAYVGYGNAGILAFGSSAAGQFESTSASGWANLAQGNFGVVAGADTYGGYFTSDFGAGVRGDGATYGGVFSLNNGSSYAYLAPPSWGITAYGDGGGYFASRVTSAYAHLGDGTCKVCGSGTVSFEQNHPSDTSKVIVYNAPEGDEVANYTRGTARLANGTATVPLGETFQWVTNPELGLTAHLTPRDEPIALAVVSVTPQELVVRGPAGSNATFDYLVYGLRIGFEDVAIVRPKQHEAFIPSMAEHRRIYESVPGLRQFSARTRYARNAGATALYARSAVTAPSGAADALRDAIHEYDPASDAPVTLPVAAPVPIPAELRARVPRGEAGSVGGEVGGAARGLAGASGEPGASPAPLLVASSASASHALDTAPATANPRTFTVGEPVEAGDLLVLDPLHGGVLMKSRTAADPLVIAIAAGPSTTASSATASTTTAAGTLEVPVVDTTFGLLKVDASFGAIRAGDLLVSSPNPGHAMRAATIVPGTVVAKAIDALETGSGTIRVLVGSR